MFPAPHEPTTTMVIFGTTELLTAFTSLAPLRMMPLCSAIPPDHKAGHVLEEDDWDAGLVAAHARLFRA